jgi:hypothetical protein
MGTYAPVPMLPVALVPPCRAGVYTRLFCFFHARVSWLVRTVHMTPGLSDSICIQHMYVKCGKLEIHLFYSPLGPLCYCVREWT